MYYNKYNHKITFKSFVLDCSFKLNNLARLVIFGFIVWAWLLSTLLLCGKKPQVGLLIWATEDRHATNVSLLYHSSNLNFSHKQLKIAGIYVSFIQRLRTGIYNVYTTHWMVISVNFNYVTVPNIFHNSKLLTAFSFGYLISIWIHWLPFPCISAWKSIIIH